MFPELRRVARGLRPLPPFLLDVARVVGRGIAVALAQRARLFLALIAWLAILGLLPMASPVLALFACAVTFGTLIVYTVVLILRQITVRGVIDGTASLEAEASVARVFRASGNPLGPLVVAMAAVMLATLTLAASVVGEEWGLRRGWLAAEKTPALTDWAIFTADQVLIRGALTFDAVELFGFDIARFLRDQGMNVVPIELGAGMPLMLVVVIVLRLALSLLFIVVIVTELGFHKAIRDNLQSLAACSDRAQVEGHPAFSRIAQLDRLAHVHLVRAIGAPAFGQRMAATLLARYRGAEAVLLQRASSEEPEFAIRMAAVERLIGLTPDAWIGPLFSAIAHESDIAERTRRADRTKAMRAVAHVVKFARRAKLTADHAERIVPFAVHHAPECRETAFRILASIEYPERAAQFRAGLKHETDPRVRRALLDAVATIGDPTDQPLVAPLLFDADRHLAADAALALGRLGAGERTREALAMILSQHRLVREGGIDALPAVPEKGPGVTRFVLEHLLDHDTDDLVRAHACRRIGELQFNTSVDAVRRHLRDPNASVRRRVCEALGILHHPLAIVDLPQIVEQDPAELAILGAVTGLGYLDNVTALPVLRGIARDAGASMRLRRAALEGIGRIRNPEALWAVHDVIDAASSEPAEFVRIALQIAGRRAVETGGRDASGRPLAVKLGGFLDARDPETRAVAAEVLGALPDPPLAALGAAFASERDPEVLRALAGALLRAGDRTRAANFREWLDLEQPVILRRTGVEAVGKLADRRAAGPLETLAREDPSVAVRAAVALAAVQISCPESERILAVLQDDPEPLVQAAVDAAAWLYAGGRTAASVPAPGYRRYLALAMDQRYRIEWPQWLEAASGQSFGRDLAAWEAWFAHEAQVRTATPAPEAGVTAA